MIILIQNFNLMNDIFTQKSISIVEVLEKGGKMERNPNSHLVCYKISKKLFMIQII